ncbi:MAG TPA: PIN domain-containing protein [Planctomycetota bacterium]|nr:PIN domain-containing protein [Planctomycetota bacterium]HRR83265.1 PIN domain-containing protein [Planctomycetota bacterium]HRT96163.1 PIN domain-containing protein [Planctomycetota bacterium]
MSQAIFADAYYLLALLNPRDQDHKVAVELGRSLAGVLVTTEAVLLEVGDGLAAPQDRRTTAAYIKRLWADPRVVVVPTDHELLQRAVALYETRQDKDWGLTDCVSFVVMQDTGIREALTGDAHFEQAGFRILFPRR